MLRGGFADGICSCWSGWAVPGPPQAVASLGEQSRDCITWAAPGQHPAPRAEPAPSLRARGSCKSIPGIGGGHPDPGARAGFGSVQNRAVLGPTTPCRGKRGKGEKEVEKEGGKEGEKEGEKGIRKGKTKGKSSRSGMRARPQRSQRELFAIRVPRTSPKPFPRVPGARGGARGSPARTVAHGRGQRGQGQHCQPAHDGTAGPPTPSSSSSCCCCRGKGGAGMSPGSRGHPEHPTAAPCCSRGSPGQGSMPRGPPGWSPAFLGLGDVVSWHSHSLPGSLLGGRRRQGGDGTDSIHPKTRKLSSSRAERAGVGLCPVPGRLVPIVPPQSLSSPSTERASLPSSPAPQQEAPCSRLAGAAGGADARKHGGPCPATPAPGCPQNPPAAVRTPRHQLGHRGVGRSRNKPNNKPNKPPLPRVPHLQ